MSFELRFLFIEPGLTAQRREWWDRVAQVPCWHPDPQSPGPKGRDPPRLPSQGWGRPEMRRPCPPALPSQHRPNQRAPARPNKSCCWVVGTHAPDGGHGLPLPSDRELSRTGVSPLACPAPTHSTHHPRSRRCTSCAQH